MNTIYRVVWNTSTNSWVVASEMAKGRKKKSSAGGSLGIAVAVVGAIGSLSSAGDALAVNTNRGGTMEACQYGSPIGAGLTASNGAQGIGDCAGGADALFLNGSYLNRQYSGTVAAYNTNTSYVALKNGLIEMGAARGVQMDNQLSMSSQNIVNLARGAVNASSADAINGSQLYGTAKSVSTALGGGAGVDANGAVTAPTIKVGDTSFSNVTSAIEATATKVNSIDALNWNAGTGTYSATHGAASTNRIANVAQGINNSDVTNVSQLKGVTSLIGGGATVSSDGSVPLGITVNNTKYNTVADAISAAAASSGNVDALKWNGMTSSYDAVHGSSATNKITHVANGSTVAGSTDAINGSQLNGTAQSVATALGGGAAVDANGAITPPTIKAGGTSYNNVTSAIEATATKVNSIDALNWDAGTGTYSATHGAASTNRIANVAQGINNSDVTNVSQLKGVTSLIGGGATVSSDGSVPLGITVNNTKYNTVADAISAAAASSGSVDALKWNSTTSSYDAVHGSSATNKITHVANGSTVAGSTDAINGSQLNGTAQSVATALGGGAGVDANGAITPPTIKAGGTSYNDVTSAIEATATKVDGIDALNWDSNAGTYSATHGTAITNRIANVAKGTADNDVTNVSQLKDLTSVLGGGTTVNADGSIQKPSINVNNTSYTDFTQAIEAAAKSGPAGDALNWDSDAGAYSAAHGSSATNKIVNIANGSVASDSNEAINGSQLRGTAQSVATVLGGGAGVDANGAITPPTIKAGGTSYNDVTSAIEATATKVDGIDALNWDSNAGTYSATHGTATTNRIANVAKGTADNDVTNVSQLKDLTSVLGGGTTVNADGSIQKPSINVNNTSYTDFATAIEAAAKSGPAGDALNWDSTAGAYSAAHGSSSTNKIVNIADGSVASDSNEAINGSQLHGTAQSVATALGGGAGVDANGAITSPAIKVGNTSYSDVTSAIEAAAAGGDALNWDVASGTYSATHGSSATNRISNVASAVNGTDAVNLNDLNTAVAPFSDAIKYIKFGNAPGANNALASSDNSLAIGGYSMASAVGATAIGVGASAPYTNSVAVGVNSAAGAANTFAVGSNGNLRSVTFVADGVNDTDAVNLGQMNTAIQDALNPGSTKVNSPLLKASTTLQATAPSSVLQATQTSSVPVESLVIAGPGGDNLNPSSAEGYKAIAMGLDSNAVGDYSVAVGQGAGAAGPNSVAIGQQIGVAGNSSIGIGVNVTTNFTSANAVAIGTQNFILQNSSNAVSIGSLNTVGGEGEVVIGSNVTATAGNSVVLGNKSSDDARSGVVSVGSSGAIKGTSIINRQIVNVAAGSKATDAVNVSQLQAFYDGLGGGAGIDSNTGAVTGPTYNITNKDGNLVQETNVGDALTAIDGRVTNVTNEINNGTIGLVQQASAGEKLTVGKDTDGTEVNFTGTAGDRTLTGVAAGVADNAAVNVKQLKDAGIIDPDGDTRDVVVYDAGTSKGQVSFGGANGTLLDKVAAGAVGSSSMQAINGSQLFGTAQSVADALGGKSAVDANGSVTKPTYTLGAGTYDNVGDALAAAYSSGGDALGWNDTAGAYDAKRGTSATNKIIDVANGAGDNDAVNVAQLKAVINGMGGGSTIDSTTGDVTGPTYNITNKDGDVVTVNNAGDAFNAIDGRITNVTNEINNGTIGLVQQAAAGEKLTVGKDTDGTDVNFTGTAGDRTLTGVAAGVADNAAVNVKQLKDAGIIDPNGDTRDVVVYDTGSSKGRVTFGGASGTGTLLDNVAVGTVGVNSLQAINGSQLFGTAQSVANALGGANGGVNADGTVKTPTYTVGGEDFNGVGKAIAALDNQSKSGNALGIVYDDGTFAKATLKGQNGTIISNVAAGQADGDAVNVKQLKDAGIIDPDGNTLDAVVYDKGSNKGKVTFGGANGTVLDNVAAGNVADGSMQAVNGGQLHGTAKSVADALGGGAGVNGDGTLSAPSYALHDSDGNAVTMNNVGDALTNLDGRVTSNTENISQLSQNIDYVYYQGTKYAQFNSTAVGAAAAGTESVALGGNAQAQADNSVALGSNSVADRDNTVSVGAAGSERQITNVAAGTQDTDAVNVGQLKAAGVMDHAAVTYDNNTDGTTNYNSITLNGGDAGTVIHNVANGSAATDAVNKGQLDAAVNDAIAQGGNNPLFVADGNRQTEQASATGTHATAMGANASATADNSVALGAGSVADRANSVSVGSAGNERQITNVAAATADTDAVNYQQYKSGLSDTLNQATSYTDSQIQQNWAQTADQFNKMNSKINQVDKTASRGIAAASALINVTPYVPGHTAVNAGVANYRGQNAIGIGVSRWSDNGRFNVNGGVSASQGGGDAVVRVGVGYVF